MTQANWTPTLETKRRIKQAPPANTDIAIIGAGLGGLMAGAYLARAGLKVAIFDQHYVAGGCCTMFSRGSGANQYNFDIGLHYIGDCGPNGALTKLLSPVGVELDLLAMDNDVGFDTLVFPDFTFPIPAGHAQFRDRLVEFFPSEKRGIDRYIRFLQEIDSFVKHLDHRGGKMGWGTAAHVALKGRLLPKYQNGTIAEFLDSCTSNPQLRAVMLGQNGDYGLPPSKVAATLHAGLVNHYLAEGGFYPRGGGQDIADQLAAEIEQQGGAVYLRRGIEKILVENGRAVGVRTETYKGEQFDVRAKTVLSNADIQVTLKQLLDTEDVGDAWQQRSDDFEMAAGIFITCLGVETDMREHGMRNSNYWQFDQYDFDDLYAQTDMQPRAAYITCASLKDPDTKHHAPAGVQNIEVMSILPGAPQHWGTEQQAAEQWQYKKTEHYIHLKNTIEANLIDRMDTLFPGSKAKVVFTESATPMSHIRFTRATDGTGYGIAATPEQFMRNRPGYNGPVENLYLCGASTRAGHGVAGALRSGYKAAKRIARDWDVELPSVALA